MGRAATSVAASAATSFRNETSALSVLQRVVGMGLDPFPVWRTAGITTMTMTMITRPANSLRKAQRTVSSEDQISLR